MSPFRAYAVHRQLPLLAGVLSLTLCGTSHAVDLEAQFNVGIGTSDNIGRVATDEQRETISVAGVRFGLTEESPRINANIRSQFDYNHYSDSNFDDEWIGGLAGSANFAIVQERLTWLVQDNFGQQATDPFATANPGNRENVNFFTTGPTINLLPAGRNILRIEGRYSTVDFEERDTDSVRKSVRLQAGREVRRGAQLTLNVSTENVEFDNNGLSSDFDRNEGFVRFELSGNRNTLGVDAGATEIDFGGSTSDGILVRLDWTRRVSANTTFVLAGGSSFSDQGDVFRFDQGNAGDLRDTGDAFASEVPFINNFVTAAYNVDGNRSTANFGIIWREEDYEGGQPLDRITTGANFSLRRDIGQSMFMGFNAQYRRRNFKDLDTADDNISASVELGYRFGQSFNASLEYNYFERSGDTALIETRENRVFLRLFYTPAWGRN